VVHPATLFLTFRSITIVQRGRRRKRGENHGLLIFTPFGKLQVQAQFRGEGKKEKKKRGKGGQGTSKICFSLGPVKRKEKKEKRGVDTLLYLRPDLALRRGDQGAGGGKEKGGRTFQRRS